MSCVVGLGPCYNTVKVISISDKAFWRNTCPRNRADFVKNGGHVRGAIARLSRKVALAYDTL